MLRICFKETWLRAYRAYPRLEPESDVRPWLYAIAQQPVSQSERVTVRAAHALSYPIPRSLRHQTQLAPFMKTKATQPSIYAR